MPTISSVAIIIESHLLSSTPRGITLDTHRVAKGLNANAEAPTLLGGGDVEITHLEEGDLSDARDSTLGRGDETLTGDSDVLNIVHVYHYTR
tara:strand:- start:62 stop:337 length:276 start_codon:yes stop_codon:yes gene_type:complete